MGTLIRLELKKMLCKKGILIIWAGVLWLSFISIRAFSMEETYADIFNKGYGLVPLMGVLMFMVFSGAYTTEYNSNMGQLIKTMKNGKSKIVMAKALAAGIGASLINFSVFFIICLSAFSKFNFVGLDLPLNNLWNFSDSHTDITVRQMIFVMALTITLGSFFFAQIGLYLSSISKSAAVPFIFGGLIMGLPYLVGNVIAAKYLIYTPLWGMMSCQLVMYQAQPVTVIMLTIMFVAGVILLPKLTLQAFIKET